MNSAIFNSLDLVSRLAGRHFSAQVFTNKPTIGGKIPAVCYVYDAKTASYIPLGKTLVTNGGGGRLTYR